VKNPLPNWSNVWVPALLKAGFNKSEVEKVRLYLVRLQEHVIDVRITRLILKRLVRDRGFRDLFFSEPVKAAKLVEEANPQPSP